MENAQRRDIEATEAMTEAATVFREESEAEAERLLQSLFQGLSDIDRGKSWPPFQDFSHPNSNQDFLKQKLFEKCTKLFVDAVDKEMRRKTFCPTS